MTWRRYSEGRRRRLTVVEDLSERFAMSSAGYRYLLHVAPRVDRVVIPRTNGRWSSVGRGLVGMVTTTGRRSGVDRTQPLVCIPSGNSLLLVGSNYGRRDHPGWVHNLLANPACTVTFRGSTCEYVAEHLDGPARAWAWAEAVDWIRGYQRYESRAAPRRIALFRLTRPDDEPAAP